jgi:hypothetical protein
LPDCGDYPSLWSQYDIRVGFRPELGESAIIGPPLDGDFPTLNLAGFNQSLPAADHFRFLIGHEMGHVLGFAHELQHPKAPNCDWDKDAIMQAEGWSPSQWTENMAAVSEYLQNGERAYLLAPYDKKSIMHYHFDPGLLAKGTKNPCYIPDENAVPDPADYNIVALRFSPEAQRSQQRFLLGAATAVSKQLGSFHVLQSALLKQRAALSAAVSTPQ